MYASSEGSGKSAHICADLPEPSLLNTAVSIKTSLLAEISLLKRS